MSDDRHAPRRDPATAEGPVDLGELADDLLEEARQLRAGRSARTLTPGAGAHQKQSLLAITAGQRLQEHVAPGPTTLLGIRGSCVLSSEEGELTLTEGAWTLCPSGPHSIEAEEDSVILLTVSS